MRTCDCAASKSDVLSESSTSAGSASPAKRRTKCREDSLGERIASRTKSIPFDFAQRPANMKVSFVPMPRDDRSCARLDSFGLKTFVSTPFSITSISPLFLENCSATKVLTATTLVAILTESFSASRFRAFRTHPDGSGT